MYQRAIFLTAGAAYLPISQPHNQTGFTSSESYNGIFFHTVGRSTFRFSTLAGLYGSDYGFLQHG
jgi:hypothetical protein